MDQIGLHKSDVARALFPNHQHPGYALNRVLEGRSELTASQLYKIADMLDCKVDDLYENSNWHLLKPSEQPEGENIFTIENGEWRAVLNADTGVSKIYSKNLLVFETVLTGKTVQLNQYIRKINSMIKELQ